MKLTLQTPAGPVAALATGAVGADAVLLVPGYTGSKEDFLPLLRPLAAAGLRAVAIDQRGQYESGWADGRGGYTIDALGAEVITLARSLRAHAPVVHLVGHSFGGLVARSAMLAEPAAFDSLTLMGSGPGQIGGERRELIEASEQVLAEQGLPGVWEQMSARAQADPRYRDSPPSVLTFLRTRFLANDPVGLQAMGDELRSAPDRTAELAGVERPVLVLHGVDDDAWPPPVQADMARRLSAAHRVVDAAAHSPAVENPSATLAELLSFFAGVRMSAG